MRSKVVELDAARRAATGADVRDRVGRALMAVSASDLLFSRQGSLAALKLVLAARAVARGDLVDARRLAVEAGVMASPQDNAEKET